MKKIYTFTLDGEDYPSKEFKSKLRVVAHLVYGDLYNYYGDDIIPLNINSNINYNDISVESMTGEYYLDSDYFDNGWTYYEPFIVGERSFGLTIDDDLIDEITLYSVIKPTLYMLKLEPKVTIKSVSYEAKDKNDEKNRRKALYLAYSNLGSEMPSRRIKFSRKRIKNMKPCFRILNTVRI